MLVATTLRFDYADKEQATRMLSSMGLTFNGYLKMAVKQLLVQGKIPFEIVPSGQGAGGGSGLEAEEGGAVC